MSGVWHRQSFIREFFEKKVQPVCGAVARPAGALFGFLANQYAIARVLVYVLLRGSGAIAGADAGFPEDEGELRNVSPSRGRPSILGRARPRSSSAPT